MEFWGIEVPAKKEVEYAITDSSYIHVSNVALGPTEGCSPNERIIVSVNGGGKSIVLGTLTPSVCDQIALDIIFGDNFTLSHTGHSCSIYFSGYRTEVHELDGSGGMYAVDDSDSESDSESEEEAEPVPQLANGKPKALKAPKLKKSPQADSSSDSDSSDNDSIQNLTDDESSDDEAGSELDSDDSSDDSDDDLLDSEDESEDELDPSPPKKKRPAESPATASAEKKRKTPTAAVPVKSEKAEKKQAEKKPETPAPASVEKTPKAGKSEKKKEKAAPKTPDTKSKDKVPKTPDTKSKDKVKSATPASQGKPGSAAKLGQYHCDECSRNFANESGLTQHNMAKHKK